MQQPIPKKSCFIWIKSEIERRKNKKERVTEKGFTARC